MTPEFHSDHTEEISPGHAYRLGVMVGKMLEAGMDAAWQWSVDANLQAFRRGIRVGLSKSSDTVRKTTTAEPTRKLRVRAQTRRAQP